MKKRGIIMPELAWLLIAIVVLVVLLLLIGIATGKAAAAIDYIKNIFRFGVR
ncbi:hypothetical protein HYV49_00105 [Candidatus Pacearchaeota archaeon]|nr:hypothetical protein [Candidatus Pacearchaeota archaeon]